MRANTPAHTHTHIRSEPENPSIESWQRWCTRLHQRDTLKLIAWIVHLRCVVHLCVCMRVCNVFIGFCLRLVVHISITHGVAPGATTIALWRPIIMIIFRCDKSEPIIVVDASVLVRAYQIVFAVSTRNATANFALALRSCVKRCTLAYTHTHTHTEIMEKCNGFRRNQWGWKTGARCIQSVMNCYALARSKHNIPILVCYIIIMIYTIYRKNALPLQCTYIYNP